MSCPTCSQTMQSIGRVQSGDNVFWCPRCGSIGNQDQRYGGVLIAEPPLLVQRCRNFQSWVDPEEWRKQGIFEAIHCEEERQAKTGLPHSCPKCGGSGFASGKGQGYDDVCDECGGQSAALQVANDFIEQLPLECVKCGQATGPMHPVGVDHLGWICPDCMAKLVKEQNAEE